MPRLAVPKAFMLALLISCTPQETISLDDLVLQGIAGTLTAIPSPTHFPDPTAIPSPTPMDLDGLFCEYQFCIGHPGGMAFYDHLASLDPQSPSQYNNGFLVAYKVPAMVISLIWLQAPGTADPEFLLDTIMDDQTDTRTGNLEISLVRGMNVMYTPINTTVSPEVPFGGAAAWTCGERVFAWKVYSSTSGEPNPTFQESLERFTCNR